MNINFGAIFFIDAILLISVSFFFIVGLKPQSKDDVLWKFTFPFLFLGHLLITQRNIIPDFFSIFIANISIWFFYLFLINSLQAFKGEKPKWKNHIVEGLCFITALIWFTWVTPRTDVRVILMALLATYYYSLASAKILPPRNGDLMVQRRISSCFLLIIVLASFFRGFLTIISGISNDFISNTSPVNATLYIIASASFLGFTFSLIHLHLSRQNLILAKKNTQLLSIQKGLIEDSEKNIKINAELAKTIEDTRNLSGFLTICARCKCVQEETDSWKPIESYIESHCDVHFSHSICTKCADEIYKNDTWYKEYKKKKT